MRKCEWCSAEIGPERRTTAKTCSDECRDQRRAQYGRDYAAEKYTPRPKRVQVCEHCGNEYAPDRPGGKFCTRRCQWNATTLASRPRTRPCGRCGAETPTRPGKPICDACKVDPRDPAKQRANDRRRTLRAYGLSEDQYQAMLSAQGGKCASCREATTARAGDSHLAIDHCHETGAVRGLLCSPCNSALGLLKEDPGRIVGLLAYLSRSRQVA